MKPSTRGSGRVFKPGNSRFWHCAFYHAGKEIRESTGVEYLDPDPDDKVQKAALRYLRARVDAVRAERAGGPALITPEQRRVTVNELLDGLEADYKARHKWNKKVGCLVKPLRAYFGHLRAVDISKTSVTGYMVKLQTEGYRDSSINRRVQLLLQSFTIAEREAPKVKRLSEVGNERQGYFERAEWLRFHACLPDYLKDFFLFAYLLGWRKGSIAKLKWSDVDGTRVLLRAENSKNRKPVTCPAIAPGIAGIIEQRRAHQVDGCPYVFHYTKKGKTRPIGDIRKAWAAAAKLAGLENKIPHDFCRTAIRNLIAAGVDEATAMRICGRRTRAIFDRYSVRNEENSERALIALDAHLREQDVQQPMLTNQLQ